MGDSRVVPESAGCTPARTGAALLTADGFCGCVFSPPFPFSKGLPLSGGAPFWFKEGRAAEADFCLPSPCWLCACTMQSPWLALHRKLEMLRCSAAI
eukprot:4638203-Amphidinium_carterae.2